MELEVEGQQQRVMSLQQLQNLMKREPEAYGPEFQQQWSHFESMLEIFKQRPQKPHNSFNEQVMFLAHVSPSFKDKGTALPGVLISALSDHFEVMHHEVRQTLVQALIMLRNRDQFPCIRTLPLYFKLFALQDKNLRKMIFTHVVRDIAAINLKHKNQKVNTELRDFFFARLKDGEVEVARRACACFVSLFRQDVWRDNHVINLMSAGLLHPDVKIAAALAHLFLGNKTKGLEGILEESDEEEEKKDNDDVVQEAIGRCKKARKTARRQKQLERAKKTAKKLTTKRRKADGFSLGVSYVAIDLLNDPQTLSERLLQRISKTGEPYMFRLLILHLISRVVGRHQAHVPNLYAFMVRYIVPTQAEVAKVLACLVEASHALVSPEELRPVVIHIMKTFVSEAMAPEVMEVGLNTIREVCVRAVNILNEDELADLCQFRTYKHKGVQNAAKGLINVYRELHPQLLHRSLRGKEATMALSRGEIAAPEYGSLTTAQCIEGIDLLLKRRDKSAGEAAASEEKKAEMMTEHVMSSDEFRKMRKLRMQRAVDIKVGRKRKADEMSSSSSSSSEDEDEEPDPDKDEEGMPGRLPGAVAGTDLKGKPKKLRTKEGRMESIKAGRTDFKAEMIKKRKARPGGKTNAEKLRNKPLFMSMQSHHVRLKSGQTARQKVGNLKKHMQTLKRESKRQKWRR